MCFSWSFKDKTIENSVGAHVKGVEEGVIYHPAQFEGHCLDEAIGTDDT